MKIQNKRAVLVQIAPLCLVNPAIKISLFNNGVTNEGEVFLEANILEAKNTSPSFFTLLLNRLILIAGLTKK